MNAPHCSQPSWQSFDGPIPTQIVSSDEYAPIAQTPAQAEVEVRLKRLADDLGRRQGMSRRQFRRTAAGWQGHRRYSRELLIHATSQIRYGKVVGLTPLI